MTQEKIQEVEMTIQENKEQVEEIIVNVLERGEKLEDIQDKAEDLKDAGEMFNKQTKKIKKKMWWQKAKPLVMVGVVILVIIGIIVIIAVI